MNWLEKAKELGFDAASPLDPQKLTAREDIRAMCAENRCGIYGANWTCPPMCGEVSECQERMRRYANGVLLQTVGKLTRTIDTKGYMESQIRHKEQLFAFAEAIRTEYPDALILGAGGCTICQKCAYPEPCRFPEKAMSSMEGYGLFVTQVCRDAGVPYYYGPKTITYTACVLYG